MLQINLSIADVAEAIELGKRRQAAKNDLWKNNDSGFHKDVANRAYPHIIGLLGELAFSRLTKLKLDREIYEKGDCGWDFNGIDIKTTLYSGNNPLLLIKEKDLEKSSTCFVLISISKDYRTATFHGYLSKEKFTVLCQQWAPRVYSVAAEYLDPIEELLKRYESNS